MSASLGPPSLTRNAKRVGAAVAVLGVAFQVVWLGLPATFLSVAMMVSYGLWVGTNWWTAPHLRAAFAAGILVFFAHAAEEFLTGFQAELPALVGRPAWSATRYLVFNGVWAVVFVTAAAALRPDRPVPVLIVLFFAVAGGVGNGVLHLLLTLQRGAYFPGAGTAPLCLAVGLWLLRLLYGPERGRGPKEAVPPGP